MQRGKNVYSITSIVVNITTIFIIVVSIIINALDGKLFDGFNI